MPVIPFRLARVSVLAVFVLAALFAPSAVLADNEGHHENNGHHEHGDGDHGDRGKGHGDKGDKDKDKDKDKDHGNKGHGDDDDHGNGNGHGNGKDKDDGDDDGKGHGKPCVDRDDMRPGHQANGLDECPEAAQPPTTGVTATAPSLSPPPAALPPCVSKRYFKITLGKRRSVRRARVLLNGRAVTVSYGKRKVKARIDLRGRIKGTYVVRTVVVTKRLRIKTGTRRYRVCGG